MSSEFEVVSDDLRRDDRGAKKSPAFVALLEGKTIAISADRSYGDWVRGAKRNGRRLRTHRDGARRIVWMEPLPPQLPPADPALMDTLTVVTNPDEPVTVR